MSGDVFTSGDQEVPNGYTEWAGVRYSGPFIPPLRQMRAFNFNPLVKRRAYAYETVDEWAAIMTRVGEQCSALLSTKLENDPSLLAMEREHLEKGMVNWRAIGYGRLVFASDFVSRSEDQAAALRPFMRARCARILETLNADPDRYAAVANSAVIRFNKGKGAPWWQPGTDHGSGLLLAIIGRKVRSYDALVDLLYAETGIHLDMTMFMRVQANRNPVPKRSIVGGQVMQIGEEYLAKIRTVKAPPFVENNITAPVFDVFKQLEIDTWPRRHVTDAREAAAIAQSGTANFASDLSTADDTIGLETLEAWHEVYLAPLVHDLVKLNIIAAWVGDFTLAYDRAMQSRRILCPARNDNEQACWLTMTGGVKSGDRGTTIKDLTIIASRNDAAVAHCSASGIKADYMSWGDDILVMTDDAKARDVWFQTPGQQHLWKDKIEPDTTYMSKRMPQGYGYFTRMVARRINREPHEEPSDAIGAALSIRASADVLHGISESHPLADFYIPLLRSAAPRLEAACGIAERATTLELMRAYSQLERPREARVTERHITDSMEEEDATYSEEMDAYLTELVGVKPVYSKKIGRYIPAQLNEEQVTKEAERWTLQSALRGLRRV